ncbi:MAG: hypothetical protein AAGI27_14625 [Pseudomonadota bacterium]
MSKDGEYISIVDWGAHVHPDTARKAKPPYRWIKLLTEDLDVHGDLTLAEEGAYVRLLRLAALTGNSISNRSGFVQRRAGVSPKYVRKLLELGLIEITSKTDQGEKSQQNQTNSSETASTQPANGQQSANTEGKGLEGNRLDKRGEEEKARERAPSGVLMNTNSPSPTIDDRPFDEIKDNVYALAMKLETNDPEQIQMLACQSLRITPKQCEIAVSQLKQDGQL